MSRPGVRGSAQDRYVYERFSVRSRRGSLRGKSLGECHEGRFEIDLVLLE